MASSSTFDATFSHHTTNVNGVRLHYVIGGKGTAVLLWHGFLETWYCWRKIMPALAEKYTVIAPDMRGYGDSEKPESGYDARTLAEDFRLLVQQLGFYNVFIIAHDMGAPPALIYAGTYPEEAHALVYLDEPVLLKENIQQILKFAPDTLQGGGLWWWVFSLAPGIPEMLIAGHEREFLSWFYDKYLYDRSSISGKVVDEYLRTFAASGGVSGAIGVYRAIFQTMEQTAPYTKQKITTPVLGLGGEQSMGKYTEQMLKAVAADVRGGVLKQCGHFIPDEQPEELLRQLMSFFEEVERL